jgi:hypothetical protein
MRRVRSLGESIGKKFALPEPVDAVSREALEVGSRAGLYAAH